MACASLVVQVSGRTISNLDAVWRFFKGNLTDGDNPKLDTSKWRTMDLPHDWSIEGSFDKNAATTGAAASLPSGGAW